MTVGVRHVMTVSVRCDDAVGVDPVTTPSVCAL
jgi:hypothetical protein